VSAANSFRAQRDRIPRGGGRRSDSALFFLPAHTSALTTCPAIDSSGTGLCFAAASPAHKTKKKSEPEPPPRRRAVRDKAPAVPAAGSRRDHRAAEPVRSSAAAIVSGRRPRGSNRRRAPPAPLGFCPSFLSAHTSALTTCPAIDPSGTGLCFEAVASARKTMADGNKEAAIAGRRRHWAYEFRKAYGGCASPRISCLPLARRVEARSLLRILPSTVYHISGAL